MLTICQFPATALDLVCDAGMCAQGRGIVLESEAAFVLLEPVLQSPSRGADVLVSTMDACTLIYHVCLLAVHVTVMEDTLGRVAAFASR